MKKLQYISIIGALALGITLTGCVEKNTSVPTGDVINSKVNVFLAENMQTYYLWQDHLPSNFPRSSDDPFGYFETYLAQDVDRWSTLTDDAESMFGSMDNTGTTFGYSLAFGQFTGTDNFFAVVQFVFAGSPAEVAGLKRGDLIVRLDGNMITAANMRNLYYSPQAALTLGYWEDGTIGTSDQTVQMTAVQMYLDPVVKTAVIEEGASKIGYLFFSDFVTGAHGRLVEVFSDFKSQGITDLVLDLRCNGGGTTSTAQLLTTMIGPVTGQDVLYREHWNNTYTEYLISSGQGSRLVTYFDDKITQAARLRLNKVYVLVSENSASASELTIVGLEPHMDVVTIGTKTHGKYCGGFVLQPQVIQSGSYVPDPQIGNWAVYLMTFKYSNSVGKTDFGDGLTPTYEVNEYINNMYPLGDASDPLFAKAISLITGAAEPESMSMESGVLALPSTLNRPGITPGMLIKDDLVLPL